MLETPWDRVAMEEQMTKVAAKRTVGRPRTMTRDAEVLNVRIPATVTAALDWIEERTGQTRADSVRAAVLAYRAQLDDDRDPEALRRLSATLRDRITTIDDAIEEADTALSELEHAAGLVAETGARIDELPRPGR